MEALVVIFSLVTGVTFFPAIIAITAVVEWIGKHKLEPHRPFVWVASASFAGYWIATSYLVAKVLVTLIHQ